MYLSKKVRHTLVDRRKQKGLHETENSGFYSFCNFIFCRKAKHLHTRPGQEHRIHILQIREPAHLVDDVPQTDLEVPLGQPYGFRPGVQQRGAYGGIAFVLFQCLGDVMVTSEDGDAEGQGLRVLGAHGRFCRRWGSGWRGGGKRLDCLWLGVLLISYRVFPNR